MAPTPKPPGQRRRRNAGQAQWLWLPVEGREGKPPELPGDDWLDSTRVWWATLWRSPMATVWQESDVDALVRLARMRDEFWCGELPVSALAAMQQLEDRFGLSPKARRMLQWEIARAGEAQSQARRPQPRRLRAIDTPS